jgi:hypothetical protein
MTSGGEAEDVALEVVEGAGALAAGIPAEAAGAAGAVVVATGKLPMFDGRLTIGLFIPSSIVHRESAIGNRKSQIVNHSEPTKRR